MSNDARQVLVELISRHGPELAKQPNALDSRLRDFYHGQSKQRVVLIQAIETGVVATLQRERTTPMALLLPRLINTLHDDCGTDRDLAHWAVETWALALGVIAQPLPVAQSAPVAKPKPTPPSRASADQLRGLMTTVAKPQPTLPSPTASTLLSGRYQDHGDGTVTDVKTGLQWMRCSQGQEWKGGNCVGDAARYGWKAAREAAETLNRHGGYAGYQDWRLPTIEELKTLIYCSTGQPKTWNDTKAPCEGKYKSPTIDQAAFPNTPAGGWLARGWFWSSSSYAGYPGGAWGVDFGSGYVSYSGKGFDSHVRLVRGGQ